MSLFSPFFHNLDKEIAILEKRIELRRSLVKEREEQLQSRSREILTSKKAFAAAAALGFVLGRSPKRQAGAAPARKGALAWVGGVAMALLQLRYGSPYQWVARIMAGLAR
jgi:hypothetical protein